MDDKSSEISIRARDLANTHVLYNLSALFTELYKVPEFASELEDLSADVVVKVNASGAEYPCEVVGYWLVSEFLAHELQKKGERIFDFYGMTIWSRTTGGQSIYQDSVIKEIAKEILEQQED